MKSICRTSITIIINISTLAYILSDCFFRENAFRESNEFASSVQNKMDSKFFRYFFILFCDILYPVVIAAILMIYYALSSIKVKALSFFIYFCLIAYFCSVVKIIYHDPRPYWVSDSVNAYECYSEYGNPSGHSMMAILFFGMMWHQYIWKWVENGQVKALSYWQKEQFQMNENLIKNGLDLEKIQENQVASSKTCKFFLFSILTLLVIFFILFGRIYLGMHSYNEVFLGVVYGFYFTYMYIVYLEDILIALIHAIIIKNAHDISENFNFISWLLFGILSALYLIFLLIPIIAFEASKSAVVIPNIWYIRIKAVCPSNGILKMFYYKCFLDCGIISTCFGILLGILFTKGKHSINSDEYMVTAPKTISQEIILRNLARIFVILLICGGIAGIFQVIPNNDDAYLGYFVNNNLGIFLGGFLLIKLVPYILHKTKLDQEEDFLKYQGGEIIIKSKDDQDIAEVKKEDNLEMTASANNNSV